MIHTASSMEVVSRKPTAVFASLFFRTNNTLGLVGGRPTRGRRFGMSRLKINEDAMTLAVAYALRADDGVTDTDKSSIVRHLNCAVFAFCRH